jgi:hypothetical protein
MANRGKNIDIYEQDVTEVNSTRASKKAKKAYKRKVKKEDWK